MEKIKIDKNAHIIDIESSVIQEEEQLCIKLSFTNISGKDISAVKFKVVGYNTFGDVVSVNGKESFMLVIQDILIKNSQKANNLKAYIPLSDIRTMNIKENQICYSDGSISSYEGEDIIEVNMEKIDKAKEVAVHTMFDNRMEYYPLHLNSEDWICGCGKWNNKAEKCSHCGNQKEKIFQELSSDGIELLVDKKKEYDLELQEKFRKEQENRERTFKKRVIGVVCALVVVLIAAIPISHQIELSKRTVFDSEVMMKESIQGTYTHYSDITGEADIQFIIDGDKVTRSYTWDNIEDIEVEITELNPSEGEFRASVLDIVVTKDGDLLEGEDLYKKGGYMSKKSSSSLRSSYESVYTAIDISDTRVYKNYSYMHCSGTVTNNGKKTYTYVKVKGAFKDSFGNVIDTAWTYAVDSEGLEPGESKKFELSVRYDGSIEDCDVSILSA